MFIPELAIKGLRANCGVSIIQPCRRVGVRVQFLATQEDGEQTVL